MNWSDIPSQLPRTLHVANLDRLAGDYNPDADRAVTTNVDEANVISSGYVAACKARGYTSVRLPWVKKAEVSA